MERKEQERLIDPGVMYLMFLQRYGSFVGIWMVDDRNDESDGETAGELLDEEKEREGEGKENMISKEQFEKWAVQPFRVWIGDLRRKLESQTVSAEFGILDEREKLSPFEDDAGMKGGKGKSKGKLVWERMKKWGGRCFGGRKGKGKSHGKAGDSHKKGTRTARESVHERQDHRGTLLFGEMRASEEEREMIVRDVVRDEREYRRLVVLWFGRMGVGPWNERLVS